MSKLRVVCFLMIFLLTGCSMGHVKDADEITINEMLSFSEAKEDSSVTITNSDDIESLIEGIERAKKQPGVAEMAEPEFELWIGNRKFFLWLDGQGTVMDQEDSHTTYALRNGVREQFEKIIFPEFEK